MIDDEMLSSEEVRRGLKLMRTLSEERQRLLHELSVAQEQERIRIAAEIHDDTAQVLDALCLRLDLAAAETNVGSAEALLRAARQVRDATERVRGLVFELMPPMPTDDLSDSLELYATSVLRDTNIGFQISGEAPGVAEHVVLLAYRIAQEALRNVVKHAEAERIEIAIGCDESELTLSVSDDGIGIERSAVLAHSDEEDLVPPHRAGLTLVGQRAAAAGGSCTTGAGIGGRGFCVEVRLPIESCEAA